MSSKTVRDRVIAIRLEILKGGLTPTRASELEQQLVAMLGSIAEEMLQADMDFNGVLLRCLGEEEKANRARIRAETSEEYRRKRTAKDVFTSATEMIRALRQTQRTATEEMRLTR